MTLTDTQNTWTVNRWTTEREDTLTRMWGAGETHDAMSERLGVSVSSITSKATVMGLPRRNSPEWPDARVELLKRLWAEGYSASQIAREIGSITRNAVIGKVSRLKLTGRKTPNWQLSEAEKTARRQIKLAKHAARERQRRNADPVKLRIRGPSKEALPPVVPWLGSLNIPLLDLQPDQCHYSSSEASPYLFCGRPTIPNQSWCSHCSKIVHAPPTGSGKQFKMNGWKAA